MTKIETIADLVNHNQQLLRANKDEFLRTFGIPLHRYMHPLWGFDVIRFDDWLKTPDGQSTHELLLEKYGQAADNLVERLIGKEEADVQGL